MDAPERGALTLVRLIGAMLIVATLLQLGLYLAKCYMPKHPVPVSTLTVILDSLPAVAGVVVLAKARAISEWISNTLDL